MVRCHPSRQASSLSTPLRFPSPPSSSNSAGLSCQRDFIARLPDEDAAGVADADGVVKEAERIGQAMHAKSLEGREGIGEGERRGHAAINDVSKRRFHILGIVQLVVAAVYMLLLGLLSATEHQ